MIQRRRLLRNCLLLSTAIVALYVWFGWQNNNEAGVDEAILSDESSLLLSSSETLRQFMVPRIPSSKEHASLQMSLRLFFRDLGWGYEIDSFTADTPLGPMPFTNLVFVSAYRRKNLVLAAHYDSKLLPFNKEKKSEFVGATDAAVSCVMLMEIARTLNPYLGDAELGLKLIFFDGEEAFDAWNDQDSLYGSRHLAASWKNTLKMQQIDTMLLLDLIGGPNPKFYSMYPETQKEFDTLKRIEQKLRLEKKLKNASPYFEDGYLSYHVVDDHTPFLSLDTRVLLLVPLPFGSHWHTMADNWDILNFDVISDLRKILLFFIKDFIQIKEPSKEEL